MSYRINLLVLALPFVSVLAAEPPANHLARESSPYLLQHAHNPVDWYPWGPEAFARAKKEDKLVFLSIGYSSCHWCHVMERESFSNEEVAKILNDHFVCIKVDREERPDIDHIYMTAVNVLGEHGGWPLSMFLTAEAKPIFGGTYWPPEDRTVDGETVKGFKSILKTVLKIRADKRKDVDDQADRLATDTARVLSGGRGSAVVELNRELVTGAVNAVKEEFDPTYGGFGSPARKFRGAKFPEPPYLRFLEYEAAQGRSADAVEILQVTLDRMARGGIYDQVGGGFHRYSTERTWTVPHFEKMLYDNAQLVEVYAHAYAQAKLPRDRRVVRQTLEFIARDLTRPEGAFYSALDADASGEEGRSYVWTGQEIDAVLTDRAAADLVKHVYGADLAPNFEDKYHILLLPQSLSERAKETRETEEQLEQRLGPLRRKLFDVRARRPQPFRDTKVLTAWNGQMIAGYATAGRLLAEPSYTQAAERAADFLLRTMRTKEGRLLRTYGAAPGQPAEAKLNGYLDDYAYFIHGLLCLHDATQGPRWLQEARALTDQMVKFHLDEKNGGFFYTSNDHEKLFARARDQHDGVQPSGNSAAALNLVCLWQKTGDEKYRALAEKSLKAFAGDLKANPSSMTALAQALALYLDVQASSGKKLQDK